MFGRRTFSTLRHRDFRHLWASLLISDFGDAVGRIALLILVFDESESTLLTASVLAISVAPFLGMGQWLTAALDRLPRRRVLATSDIIRAGCYFAMAAPVGTGGRLALLFLASSVEPPFLAIRRSLVPKALPQDELNHGIALTSATTEIALLCGALLGGLAVAGVGAETVLVANAATFAVSAWLLGSLRIGDVGGRAAGTSSGAHLQDGLAALRTDSALVFLWVTFPLLSAVALGMEAIMVPYVAEDLGYGEAVVGVVAATVSVAVLVATAVVPRRAEQPAMLTQIAAIGTLGATIVLAGFVAPANLGTALLAFAGAGVIFAVRIPTQILVATRLESAVLPAASSILDGTYALGQVTVSLVAGGLAEGIGAADTGIALGTLGVLVGVGAFALRPRTDPVPAAD